MGVRRAGWDRHALEHRHANLADQALARVNRTPAATDWPEYDDGWVVHAPVHSMAPNPWGLHHVHGNVYEWCLDRFVLYSIAPARPGDGLREHPDAEPFRNARGGAFQQIAARARSAARDRYREFDVYPFIGVRPARPLVGWTRD
jgi:formylglycine-generating enzyme required for sulfatase activity